MTDQQIHEYTHAEKSAKKAMVLNRILIHGIIFSLLLYAYIAYSLFYPVKILTQVVQPYKVTTKEVAVGEKIAYIVDGCKTRDAVGIVRRVIVVEGLQYQLEPDPGTVKKGCNKVVVSVRVPSGIPTGTAYMEINIAYELNAFRHIFYHLETEKFEIIEGQVK